MTTTKRLLILNLLLLLLVLQAFAIQAENLFSDLPVQLALREEIEETGPFVYQYKVTPLAWQRKKVLQVLSPYLSVHRPVKRDIHLTKDWFSFQSLPYQLYDGNNGIIGIDRNTLLDIPIRQDITGASSAALKDLGWADEPKLIELISLDEYIQYYQTDGQIYGLPADYFERTYEPYREDSVYFASYAQTLEGWLLAPRIENASDDQFHKTRSGFTLDSKGYIIGGSMHLPWEIVSKAELPFPAKNWRDCFAPLRLHYLQLWGKNGITTISQGQNGEIIQEHSGRIVDIKACYIITNDGLAVPGWQFSLECELAQTLSSTMGEKTIWKYTEINCVNALSGQVT
ncbi:MAG: hypothetical protein GX781_06490 [Clostridiales bacterium]|nr:hypothetical protein [Clostridiales bacterium]